jgi:hypothetical protein
MAGALGAIVTVMHEKPDADVLLAGFPNGGIDLGRRRSAFSIIRCEHRLKCSPQDQ